jgi:hypothetical protein
VVQVLQDAGSLDENVPEARMKETASFDKDHEAHRHQKRSDYHVAADNRRNRPVTRPETAAAGTRSHVEAGDPVER